MSAERVPVGYIARSVDKDAAEPWQVDEELDGYEPVEPYSYLPRPARKAWSVHPHMVPLPEDWQSWRVEQTRWCECRRPAALVRIKAGSDGHRWALIPPERIAKHARRAGHRVQDDLATVLHCDDDGHPHVEITSCKGCGQHWLVLLFEDAVELVKVHLVQHGLRVAPDRTAPD